MIYLTLEGLCFKLGAWNTSAAFFTPLTVFWKCFLFLWCHIFCYHQFWLHFQKIYPNHRKQFLFIFHSFLPCACRTSASLSVSFFYSHYFSLPLAPWPPLPLGPSLRESLTCNACSWGVEWKRLINVHGIEEIHWASNSKGGWIVYSSISTTMCSNFLFMNFFQQILGFFRLTV